MIDFPTILDNISNPNTAKKTILEWSQDFGVSEKDMNAFIKEKVASGDIVLSKKGKVMHPHEFDLYKGSIFINSKGHGYVSVDGLDDDIFVSASYIEDAMHKDIVQVHANLDHGERFAKVVNIIERATTQMVGTLTLTKRGWEFFPVDVKLQKRYPITIDKSLKVKSLDMVVASITSYKPLKFKLKEVLGSSKTVGMDILAILIENKVPIDFSDKTKQEIKSINENIVIEPSRVDYRNHYVVTIDGEDAKDLDDAISIAREGENFRLQVHIADVSYYVREGTALDQDAYQRGTSVYAANTVTPMLPEILSNGVCSLHPEVDRYTLTASMLITPSGNIEDIQLHPSIIHSKRRLSYTYVNACVEDETLISEEDSNFKEFLKISLECSDALNKRKELKGQLDFNTIESKFIMNEGKIIDVVARSSGRSERLIEDFMVAANEAVAYTLRTMHLPGLYRIHENPDPDKIQSIAKLCALHGMTLKVHQTGVHQTSLQKALKAFEDSPMFPAISTLMLRSMKKAVYSDEPLGHFGLALQDYTHFTSPIRRYPDLVVHRMLRKYVFESKLDQKSYAKDSSQMKIIATQASFTERRAVDAERAVEDMKKAEFMMNHINDVFDGIISGITTFGFFVMLPNSIEGLVHMSTLHDDYYIFDQLNMRLIGERRKKVFSLGDEIKVSVTNANKDTRTIDFKYLKHGPKSHE
jgi:ribonuclease R